MRFLQVVEGIWLRGQDLNLRPLGYEPNELPDCSTPHNYPSVGVRIGQILRQTNKVPAPIADQSANTAVTRHANSRVPADTATSIFCSAFATSARSTAISAVVMAMLWFFNNSAAGAMTVDTSTSPPSRLVQ